MSPTEWTEDHGYVRYKCWRCGRTFYSDGEPECCDEQEADEENDSK
jgi:DNA-directed RNA polymerase subunit RPC12/RpoP